MSKLALKLWIAATLLLLLPWFANAAGLGKLTLLSALGQTLNAEIDLVSVNKEDSGSLAARLASQDAYQQANLQYPPLPIGIKLSVERRSGGQPYIKVTSARAINEPVMDLLVDLAWPAGRISRAYTVLIDPPGYAGSSAQPAPAAAAEARPIAPPPSEVTAPIEQRPVIAGAAAQANQYGPIKRGETLAGVAGAIKPDGITLEQMLVGLYRKNPDAFVRNMNRMKTGPILNVPAREELAALSPVDATKEVRIQASDWNNYRRKLAETAGAAPEERGPASGRIVARADDRSAAEGDRDVVRLSRGEPVAGAGAAGRPRSTAARLRALEEEAVAREKALSEANQRIAELENTIKDQQRLLTLKGVVPPSPSAGAKPVPGEAKPSPRPEAAAAGAKVEPPRPVAPAEGAKVPPPAGGDVAAPPVPESKAKPKPKVVPAPPPDLIDTLLGEPLYLAGALLVVALAGAGYWYSRRRRTSLAEEEPARVSPTLHAEKGPAIPQVFATPGPQAVAAAAAVGEQHAGDEVDALAEAEVYIAYGRDTQAEQILKEALAASPSRQEVMLKLLEIYASRKDRAAFAQIAEKLRTATNGEGENWAKATAMGLTIDPDNKLYQGSAATPSAPPEESVPLDLDLSAPVTAETAAPEKGSVAGAPIAVATAETVAATIAMQSAPKEEPAPAVPDFTLEIPGAETTAASAATGTPVTTAVAEAPAATAAPEAQPAATVADSNMIDFKIELPPAEESKPQELAPAQTAAAPAEGGLDFKLDFSDINLNLDEHPPAPAAAAAPASEVKDAHWHDVQQKFDLAKAYEEMGDKDGAREVLQEVVGEGDEQQQTQAKKLLEALV